jgi:hypothetical protein
VNAPQAWSGLIHEPERVGDRHVAAELSAVLDGAAPSRMTKT